MKETAKNILKAIGLYHPLQGFYRSLLKGFTRARYQKQYKKHKGQGYTCNYCFATYSKFAPWYPAAENRKAIEINKVVAGYGDNIICPNCLSTARERLVKVALDAWLSPDDKKILHISPEESVYKFIKSRAEVIAADYMPGFYKRTASSVQFADATRLAFGDNEFDMVIANHIMEHIPADRTALHEIYRVLKPGGIAILQVPFSTAIPSTLEDIHLDDPGKQSALYGQKDHVRIYQLDDYMQRAREAGLLAEYFPYESLSDFYKYALQPGEGFISIRKPGPHTTQAHVSKD